MPRKIVNGITYNDRMTTAEVAAWIRRHPYASAPAISPSALRAGASSVTVFRSDAGAHPAAQTTGRGEDPGQG